LNNLSRLTAGDILNILKQEISENYRKKLTEEYEIKVMKLSENEANTLLVEFGALLDTLINPDYLKKSLNLTFNRAPTEMASTFGLRMALLGWKEFENFVFLMVDKKADMAKLARLIPQLMMPIFFAKIVKNVVSKGKDSGKGSIETSGY
jgi:hypothetical protein